MIERLSLKDGRSTEGPTSEPMETMRQAATSGVDLTVRAKRLGGFLRMQSG
jgi:hypothetical protein